MENGVKLIIDNNPKENLRKYLPGEIINLLDFAFYGTTEHYCIWCENHDPESVFMDEAGKILCQKCKFNET